MTTKLTVPLTSILLLAAVSGTSLANPIRDTDGSLFCNASGPSNGVQNGICANTQKKNDGFCTGGMSSEPGGGTRCSGPFEPGSPSGPEKKPDWAGSESAPQISPAVGIIYGQ